MLPGPKSFVPLALHRSELLLRSQEPFRTSIGAAEAVSGTARLAKSSASPKIAVLIDFILTRSSSYAGYNELNQNKNKGRTPQSQHGVENCLTRILDR